MQQLKIHIAAVAVIIVLLVVVFYLTNDKEQKTAKNEYYIEIIHSTWGMNCVNRRRTGNNTAKPKYPFVGDPALPLIRKDNVISKVSTLCNAKSICKIDVSEATFGFNPDKNCSKNLDVEYRCFSYDRPWFIRGGEYDTLIIDCTQRASFK